MLQLDRGVWMRLALRRIIASRGMVVAAAVVTLIAVTLLSALIGYGSAVARTGAATVIAAATPQERSLLVRGSGGGSVASLDQRDAAVRAALAAGTAAATTRVAGARYATGQQLTGGVGRAAPDADGLVFASVVAIDGLDRHADLTAGAWPRPGQVPVQVAVGAAAAATLGLHAGDLVPLADRLSGAGRTAVVTGVWQPRSADDPYWLLLPEAATGVAPGTATYGPLVVTTADFDTGFAALASAGWLAEPDLTGADTGRLTRISAATAALAADLPRRSGLGDSAVISTGLDQLTTRLRLAALVGRSAMVTPVLLVALLGGYALLEVAALLAARRRTEEALLRARGAAAAQLTALAAREAVLVVAPAVLAAPLLATVLLGRFGLLGPLAGGTLRIDPRLPWWGWLVAALAGVGCLLAMLVPALRPGGTYTEQLAARSRPRRRGALLRGGVDLALLVAAVIGWTQLRRYASPLAAGGSGLGVDPLLASAPIVAVLAGASLALRPLPALAGAAERYLDRRNRPAALLGVWQARRRPGAGPVLLLALAVAASTMAWCLAAIWRQSVADQADHRVGADLRLAESAGYAPAGRGGQVTALPGVAAALPGWREQFLAGPRNESVTAVGLDATAAARVVRLRSDLAGGQPAALYHRLATARVGAGTGVALPAGTRRLAAEVTATVDGVPAQATVSTVLAHPDGQFEEVPLGGQLDGRPARLVGCTVQVTAPGLAGITWRLDRLRAETAAGATPLAAAGTGWAPAASRAGPDRGLAGGSGPGSGSGPGGSTVAADGAALRGGFTAPATPRPGSPRATTVIATTPTGTDGTPAPTGPSAGATPTGTASAAPADAGGGRTGPVPVAATPQALAAMRLPVGGSTQVRFGRATVEIKVVATVASVPSAQQPAALLVDLPSLSAAVYAASGTPAPVSEWWLATTGDGLGAARTAAAGLDDVEVLDRRATAATAGSDPYGVGARTALFAAAVGAVLLAGVGIGLEILATARRRDPELAVLHLIGAPQRTIARAMVTEHAVLGGFGVAVGLAVGVLVAATTAPLTILTPAAQRPVPEPRLVVATGPVLGSAAALLALALGLSWLVGAGLRGRLAVTSQRIGADR